MESSGNQQVAEDITEFMSINDIDLTELKSLKGDNPKTKLRSKLKNLHNRINTRESWDAFKTQRNKCVAIKRKNLRTYFSLLAKDNGHNNKKFWSAVKPFLSDKGTKKSDDIVLNDDGKTLTDSKEVSEVPNTYFTDIVKITTGEEPRTTSCNRDGVATDEIIEEIISRFKDHPSIKIIKSHIPQDDQKFSSKLATGNSIKKIIDKLNTKTSISFDSVPSKLVKLASKIISEPLSQLVNRTIVNEGFFLDAEKIACITPAFKKEDRLDKTNYRQISVLNVFSKVFERFILDQLTSYFKNILSEFLSAYRKQYSC